MYINYSKAAQITTSDAAKALENSHQSTIQSNHKACSKKQYYYKTHTKTHFER